MSLNPESVRFLASTPPPRRKYSTSRDAIHRVQELEKILGVHPAEKTHNVNVLNARITELEDLVAMRTAQTQATVETAIPALGSKNLATAAQFLAMSTSDRKKFAADGGSVSVDEFNKLPVAARLEHLSGGGSVESIPGTQSERVFSADPIRENANILSLSVFQKLGKNDQKTFIRLGGIIGK